MQDPAEVERRKDVQLSIREALSSKKGCSSKDQEANSPDASDHSDDDDGDEAKFDERMRLQILRKRKELGDIKNNEKFSKGNLFSSDISMIHLRAKCIQCHMFCFMYFYRFLHEFAACTEFITQT